MNKAVLASAVLLIIFISLMVEADFANFAEANPYPYTNCDSSFVTVSILSPENKTYDSNSILLNITAGAYPGVWFLEYSLDGAEYVEIAPGHLLSHILTESVLVEQLPKGSHSIEVKASAMANDEDGLVIAYSTVYFAITKDLETTPTPVPTYSPSPEPTISTSPTPLPSEEQQQTSQDMTGPIFTVTSIAIFLCLLVYFVKRK